MTQESQIALIAHGITNSGLIRLKKKKAAIIYVIIGIGAVFACLIIIWIGAHVRKAFERLASQGESGFGTRDRKEPPPIPKESKIKIEYNAVHNKVKRMPAGNKNDIDKIIAEWDEFINKYPDDQNDKSIIDAKQQRKTMISLKELY